MKSITIVEAMTGSIPDSFEEVESGKRILCAHIGGQDCSPNCAACKVASKSSVVIKVECLRGPFIIGAIKQ